MPMWNVAQTSRPIVRPCSRAITTSSRHARSSCSAVRKTSGPMNPATSFTIIHGGRPRAPPISCRSGGRHRTRATPASPCPHRPPCRWSPRSPDRFRNTARRSRAARSRTPSTSRPTMPASVRDVPARLWKPTSTRALARAACCLTMSDSTQYRVGRASRTTICSSSCSSRTIVSTSSDGRIQSDDDVAAAVGETVEHRQQDLVARHLPGCSAGCGTRSVRTSRWRRQGLVGRALGRRVEWSGQRTRHQRQLVIGHHLGHGGDDFACQRVRVASCPGSSVRPRAGST